MYIKSRVIALSTASTPTTTTTASGRKAVDPYATPRRGPNYHSIMPLLYAPVLPLIRIVLRGRMPQQKIDMIFGGAVLTALAHAGYIMSQDSSV